MCTDIDRIAELAKEDPKRQFFSIAHLITVEKMCEAFRSLRKDASAGIDGVTYEQYEANAEENIRQLHQRLKGGKYQVQPLRRVYIPKEDGKQRPISIPALEDKVVQKVTVDLLNAIYEQDFLDCSYGFPSRTWATPSTGRNRTDHLYPAYRVGSRDGHPLLLGFIFTMVLWLIK